MPDSELYPVSEGRSKTGLVSLVIAAVAVLLSVAALIVAIVILAKANKTYPAAGNTNPTLQPVTGITRGTLPPRITSSTPTSSSSSTPPPTTTSGYNQAG